MIIIDDTEVIVHANSKSKLIAIDRWYGDSKDDELKRILIEVRSYFNIQGRMIPNKKQSTLN